MRIGTPADERLKAAIRLPVVLWGPGASQFLDSVKSSFNLQDVEDLTVTDQGFAEGDTTVYLSFIREVPIHGKELEEADGLIIKAGGTLILHFSSKGELVVYVLDDTAEATTAEEKKGVLDMVQTGRVYFAQPGETVDIDKLTQEGKRFYIQVDKNGKKRLHRVYR